MQRFTTRPVSLSTTAPLGLLPQRAPSRSDPTNIDLPVTEPIDITEMVRLVSDRS